MNAEEGSAAAFHLRRDFGPGLLESVCEAALARMLRERGLGVGRIMNNHQHFASLRLRVNQ